MRNMELEHTYTSSWIENNKWSCLLFMFLQLKFVYMFVEAEHEQICPRRHRRYVLAKGSDLEATTSGLCIAIIHRDLLCTLYANV